MEEFTSAQRKKINKPALASKHGCTETYIRLVLRGKREDNTDLAKAIKVDARRMLEIMEPKMETDV